MYAETMAVAGSLQTTWFNLNLQFCIWIYKTKCVICERPMHLLFVAWYFKIQRNGKQGKNGILYPCLF